MKKHIKLFFLLLAGLSLFTACKDDDDIQEAALWNATEDYADISFVESSTSIEIDPADDTSYTLHMSRRNTAGDISVPIDIIQGDSSVFSVSNADFADGDSITTFVLSFPNAEIGTTYTVQLGVTDPKYTSYYSDAVFTNFTVTRVKWNSIGMGTYTDAWFESEQEVEIFQNESQPNIYRITKPYSEYDGDDYFDMSGEMDDYLTITVRKPGETFKDVTFTRNDLVTYDDYYTGAIHPTYQDVIVLLHPSRMSSLRDESNYLYNRITAFKEDGTPGVIQLAPYFYMFSVGGWNYTQYSDIILITFPGYVAEVPDYEAQFDEDFDWSDVKTFDLTNTLTGESSNVMLQKATCNIDTDGCDTIFAQTYGTPYRIKDAYAEGYDLVFFQKGNKIYVPDDIWDELQETGVSEGTLTATDLYAYIDPEGSSMEVDEDGDIQSVTLNVTFTDKTGNTVYGKGTQTLDNVTWTQIGTGTYTYTVMFDEPTPDEDLPFSQQDGKDNIYCIGHWFYDVDFTFYWDQETNQVVIPVQYTGLSYDGYGDVYVCDVAQFTGNDAYYASYPCNYDPEAKTFTLNPIYFILQSPNQYQWLGDDPETFEVEFGAAAVKAKAPMASELNIGNARKLFNKKQNAWSRNARRNCC